MIDDIQNIAGGKITRTGEDATVMAISNRGDIIFKDITANVSGKGNNTFDPGGVATRAEAASMLMRFCENIAK